MGNAEIHSALLFPGEYICTKYKRGVNSFRIGKDTLPLTQPAYQPSVQATESIVAIAYYVSGQTHPTQLSVRGCRSLYQTLPPDAIPKKAELPPVLSPRFNADSGILSGR
jgi:hypothetical protein